MTNLYEATPSNEDDPASCADDVNTSFEIDEPDDEEVIDDVLLLERRVSTIAPSSATIAASPTPVLFMSASASASSALSSSSTGSMITPSVSAHSFTIPSSSTPTNTMNVTSPLFDDEKCARVVRDGLSNVTITANIAPVHRKACEDSSSTRGTYAVPLVSIRSGGDLDADAQSELSLDSNTASSTPTTADVADVTAAIAVVSPYTHKLRHLTALQQAKLAACSTAANLHMSMSNNPSYTEDTLSASIATTTTEIDLDGMPSVSPNTRDKLLETHPVRAALTSIEGENHLTTSGSNLSGHQHHKRTMSNISQHTAHSLPGVQALQPRTGFFAWIQWICAFFKSSGIGEPSVYHAVIVIFLEFFAWGLLAMPVINVLNQTFPDHTFLMNGLVMGIKGILSFLSAPLVGALSDIWGRKFFLLITVFFTCAPIPLMTINSWWFFAMISISGIFAVTFSVVFAYVADVTTMEERSRAYGLVSATFAASLVISPALGALLRDMYSDTLVVALATAIAVLDVFFILVAVPESLPEKVRPLSWGAPISWEQADPFSALRKVGTDHTILMQCVTVLLSYLPEAGQYSCIFVYLKLKMGFNSMEVAIFIAVVGILSISVQVILGYLMRVLGGKRTIIFGLILEMIQLLWYGFGSQAWMMWAAGILAAIASITYPAISAFVSLHSTADSQGVVQGMVTGMRGLCNGLGPAMFGVIFYFFNVDLNAEQTNIIATDGGSSVGGGAVAGNVPSETTHEKHSSALPGPPFAIGALMVVLAILVAIFIPDTRPGEAPLSRAPSEKKRPSKDVQYTLAQL